MHSCNCRVLALASSMAPGGKPMAPIQIWEFAKFKSRGPASLRLCYLPGIHASLPKLAKKSSNFLFTTKMVFPKSLKSRNSGSEYQGSMLALLLSLVPEPDVWGFGRQGSKVRPVDPKTQTTLEIPGSKSKISIVWKQTPRRLITGQSPAARRQRASGGS